MEAKEISEKIERILKLDTHPVALKFYEKKEEMPRRPINSKMNACQLVSIARYQGTANALTPEMHICAIGSACLGIIKTPEIFSEGKAPVGRYVDTEETGKKFIGNVFKLGDTGKRYAGIMVEPLGASIQEPDVVVIYANPNQIMRLIHACVYDTGEKVAADTVAEAALCSGAGFAMAKKKPIIGFPCAGDRRFGGTQVHELVFAMPYSMAQKIAENLETTGKLGASMYPVAPFMFWTPVMAPAYAMKDEYLNE
jgi:uncharacterized protein (DUF169 family)